jgi:hypothetical protein
MWLRKCLVAFLILVLVALCTCVSAAQLVWDTNTESDLAGYKIHYSSVHGPPYSHEVDVGNVTQWTIPTEWPRNQDYFFAATAYDRDGYESIFSNETIYYRDTVAGPALATDIRVTFNKIEGPSIMPLSHIQIKGNSSSSNTLTITLDSTPAAGNILFAVVHISQYGVSRTCTPPSGWTTVGNKIEGTVRAYLMWNLVETGDSAGNAFSFSGASDDWSCGIIYEITGADTTAPINQYALNSVAGESIDPTAGPVTPDVTGTLGLAWALNDYGSASSAACTGMYTAGWTHQYGDSHISPVPNQHILQPSDMHCFNKACGGGK